MSKKTQKDATLRFIADQPIYDLPTHVAGEDRQDGLGFDGYAETLAGFALSTDGPFTIGIHGRWGHGKTSLLRVIEKRLVNEGRQLQRAGSAMTQKIVPVRFNAWQFENEPNPLMPLLLSVNTALAKSEEGWLKWNKQKKLKRFQKVLKGIASGVLASTEVKLDAKIVSGSLSPAKFVSGFRDQAQPSRRMNELLTQRTTYYQAFELLQEVCNSLQGEIKVVLFIDDLDRCSPEKALQVLESIKLLLWQPGFIFFLAVDNLQLERYIDDRIKAVSNEQSQDDEEWGRKYFEKLIQVNFHIPQHDGRYEGFIDQLYKLTGWNEEETGTIRPLLGAPLGYNPRRTIKVLNSVLLIEKLLPSWFERNISAITVEILLTVRFSRTVYQLFTGSDSEENQEIRSIVRDWEKLSIKPAGFTKKKYPGAKGEKLRQIWLLISEDESLRSVLFSTPGKAWLKLLESERRVIARLIDDQKISNNFAASDISAVAKGNEAYIDGDYIRAFDHFTEALSVDPRNVDAHVGLEKVEHVLKQRTFEPIDELTGGEVMKRLSDLWDIAHQSMRDGDFLRAEKALHAIIKIDSHNAAAYNRLGILHAKQKEYTDALAAFEKAVKLEPTASSYHNLGLIKYETEDYKGAAKEFKKALSYDDTLAARHVAYAKVCQKLGNDELMLEELRKAVELEPTKETYSLLYEAYIGLGRTAEAKLIGRVLKGLPKNQRKRMRMPRRVPA